MILLIVYVVLVTIGEILAFGLGLFIDNVAPDGWSMIISMGLVFGVLWGGWPVAVFVTDMWLADEKPRAASRAKRAN